MKRIILLLLLTLTLIFLRAQTPTYALVNYYPLNGVNGTDASGRNMNATITGTTSAVDRFDQYPKAISFSSNGDLLTFEHHNLGMGEWSYSIWVRFDALPSTLNDAFLLSYANIAAGDDVPLFVDDKDNTIKTYFKSAPSSTSLLSTGVVVEKGRWYNIVMTYTSSTTYIYVDGVLKASSNNRFTSNTSTAQLAVSSIYPTEITKGRLVGAVDDIKFYTGAIPSSDINIISAISYSNSSQVKVFSNSENSISISADEPIAQVDIFDINGRNASSQKPNDNYTTINNLSKGIYIVKVISNNQSYVRKVILN